MRLIQVGQTNRLKIPPTPLDTALDGTGTIEPLLHDPAFNQRNAQLSPDDRWLACESDESGNCL